MLRTKLKEVQAHLKDAKLDGWLLFDFRGMNPFVKQVAGVTGHAILSRRWWLYVPADGEPSITVHAIERGSFPDLGMALSSYSSRTDLPEKLRGTLGNAKRIAMEYSPNGNIPYVSKVDAGSMDLVRSLGVDVVSSGDLLQLFLAWREDQLENHRKAAQALTETKDAALAMIRECHASNRALSEFELQSHMVDWMLERGMNTDHGPIVCFGVTSNDPHYSPSATRSNLLAPGPVLMDLFCNVKGTDGYCADITWMAHLGTPSDAFLRAFQYVTRSRDAGVDFLRSRLEAGQAVRGFEVDNTVRQVLVDAGYEPYLLHRTGHSLGIHTAHGDAAHFDGIETLDERLILPHLGFTIEPGVYTPEFGVRSEINVYSTGHGLEITTALQTELDVL
jgi:Xaa-Pro aminopeptidase